MMIKIENKDAICFYEELLSERVVEKNEEMRDRLLEVTNWRNAFAVIMKHAAHFRVKFIERDKLDDILKKYQFDSNLMKQMH